MNGDCSCDENGNKYMSYKEYECMDKVPENMARYKKSFVSGECIDICEIETYSDLKKIIKIDESEYKRLCSPKKETLEKTTNIFLNTFFSTVLNINKSNL